MSDENDERFLNQFREGSPEREYHSALLRVIRSVPYPLTERAGFALLWLLHYERLVAGSVDTWTHPIAGSSQEDAELVSHAFGRDSASVWLARFQAMHREEFDPVWLERWRAVFKPPEGER
ncbi:hypothetical protein ACLESD_04215 [Pyxidicoccus sp. 3LFB2]